jgi:hypothetical protein
MVKPSTVIGIAIVGAVGLMLYFLIGKGGGSGSSSNPSLSTPQSAQIGAYPSANSSASGSGLSISEVYNYSPSTISESSHTYQTTNTTTINPKLGLFNF